MAEIALKLTWASGSAEIACDAAEFDRVVDAAAKLLANAPAAPAGRAPANGVPEDRQVPDTVGAGDTVAKTEKRPKVRRAATPSGATREKAKGGTGYYKDFENFKWDLTDDEEVAIKKFYVEKAPKGQKEQVAVLLAALRDFARRPVSTYDEIYKAFKICDRGAPMKSLSGVITNMANLNWVAREDTGIRLKAFGDDMVGELPRGDKSKPA